MQNSERENIHELAY